MGLRPARLIAQLTVLCSVGLGALILLCLGPHALLRINPDHTDSRAWPAWVLEPGFATYAALVASCHGLVFRMMPRWRRNLVRAGSLFALSWVCSPLLVLAVQFVSLAAALHRPVSINAVLAVAMGAYLVLQANLASKTRAAWFNGSALPLFASRPAVWGAVQRSSSPRGLALGSLLVAAGLIRPHGLRLGLMLQIVIFLEGACATIQAVFLSWQARRRETLAEMG